MASNDTSGQTKKQKSEKKTKNNSSLRKKKCKIKIFFKPNKKFSTYEVTLSVKFCIYRKSLFKLDNDVRKRRNVVYRLSSLYVFTKFLKCF